MDSKHPGRRRFIRKGVAFAGLAVSPAGMAVVPESASAQVRTSGVPDMNSMEYVLYGARSHFVDTVRILEGPNHHEMRGPRPDPYRPGAGTPVKDLIGTITPTSLHFTTQHFYGIPDINPEEHRLVLHGLVERPLVFTLDDLKRFPAVSRVYFLECVGNRPNPNAKTVSDSHGRMGCSEWTGVPLSVLLNEVGLKNGAKWIVAEGSDSGKHEKSVPIAKALDDVMVAYGQNGEPVRPDHGFPLRLIVPGFEGIYNVKWLRRIKVVDREYLTFQEHSRFLGLKPQTQPDTYEFGPSSVITYPSGSHRLPAHGVHTISGLAWSGGGRVRKVEVSTDGGKTYREAELAGSVLPKAHTRFLLPWRWDGEEAIIQSRCTDEKGQVQPTETEFARFWGFNRQQLYSTISSQLGHANWIMPWRVNRDGNVTNALAPVGTVTDVHGD